MKNIFLALTLSLSGSAFANLGQPERVPIHYPGPYSFPESVKMAAISTLIDKCYYHQNAYNWSGGAKLIPKTTYTYKVEMAGEDAQIPHAYVYSSMTIEYDAVSKTAQVSNFKCN